MVDNGRISARGTVVSDHLPRGCTPHSESKHLTTLVVLLQGVWAGIFLQRGGSETWVNVHGIGAHLAAVLSVAAAIVAVVRLRSRRDLVIGSAGFAVLIIIETGLGGAVRGGADGLTVVHIPLAMAIMGLAVRLALRARARA